MKKLFPILAALVLSTATQLEAFCCISPEVEVAYFHPLSSRFRDIYGGGAIYTFELNVQTWCQLYTFANVSYFNESGRSIGEKNKTEITLIPVAFGLKYLWCCDCFNPYIAAGPLFTHMKTDDHSPYVIKKNEKWGYGATAKVGTLYYIWCNLFLDAFINYSYMCIGFDHVPSDKPVVRHDADLSGFSFGGGLGYSF